MNYLKMKKDELMAICKDRGIKNITKKNKEELIKLIKQSDTTSVSASTFEAETDNEKEENTPWKNYKDLIINHINYEFIPKELKQNWVKVSKNSQNPRKEYWDTKQKELIDLDHIPKESIPVNVARFIHPTKMHVCEKCGIECSIYYEYPTSCTWKWLKTKFNYNKDDSTKFLTIFDIYEEIKASNKEEIFKNYFGKTLSDLRTDCKADNYSGKRLSPGVMSNAPDRLDGFHSYNSICGCRSKHDKGRSIENMKSYTRDRRAYELLSDGKLLLANCLMGKLNTVTAICFICGKPNLMSGDHIGPISLGFIHDPVNFQACCKSCNSNKNNRITQKDIEKIKSMEENGACLVSWWAKDTWEMNKCKDISTIRNKLNTNTKRFLSIIQWIKINRANILESFITDNYMDHDKSYNIKNIEIISSGDIKFEYSESDTGKKTKDKQKKRTKEILLELDNKDNRKIKIDLSSKEIAHLSDITLSDFKNKICKVLVGL